MAYAHSSDVKAERGRSCLEGGGIVASGVWQSRADVRQQDLLLYEQRGCTNSVAVRTGWQPVRVNVASLQIQGCHHVVTTRGTPGRPFVGRPFVGVWPILRLIIAPRFLQVSVNIFYGACEASPSNQLRGRTAAYCEPASPSCSSHWAPNTNGFSLAWAPRRAVLYAPRAHGWI